DRVAVVVRARAPPPPGAVPGPGAGLDARVDGDGEGAQAPRLPLCRSHHRVRAHAGDRDGRRSRRWMPRGRRLSRGVVMDPCAAGPEWWARTRTPGNGCTRGKPSN